MPKKETLEFVRAYADELVFVPLDVSQRASSLDHGGECPYANSIFSIAQTVRCENVKREMDASGDEISWCWNKCNIIACPTYRDNRVI